MTIAINAAGLDAMQHRALSGLRQMRGARAGAVLGVKAKPTLRVAARALTPPRGSGLLQPWSSMLRSGPHRRSVA